MSGTTCSLGYVRPCVRESSNFARYGLLRKNRDREPSGLCVKRILTELEPIGVSCGFSRIIDRYLFKVGKGKEACYGYLGSHCF